MLLCWCEIALTDNSVQLVQFGNKCTSVSFIILCPRISHNSFAKIVSISQLMSSIYLQQIFFCLSSRHYLLQFSLAAV